MRAPWILSTAVYVAAALLLCHAIVAELWTTLPSDLGDPVLNTWIIWWNAHVLPLTERWWNAPFFFPTPGVLAYSETLLGLAILTTPLQWIGLPAVAAYNVAFVGSFILCALAMHLLVWRLTGRHDAALLAGLVYGFNPYRIAHAPHLQLLSSYWLPLALAGLHDYVNTARRRGLVVFAASWLVQSLISGYFLFYSSVLIALWILWFASISRRTAAAIAVAWMLAAAACLPVLVEYRRVQQRDSLARGIGEIESFGADVSALFAPSERSIVWGARLMAPRPEGELFVGFAAMLLVGLAVRRAVTRPIGRPTIVLLAVAIVPAAVGLISFWSGGFVVDAGPLHVSVGRAYKPISFAVWLVLLAVLVSGPFRAAFRRRSVFGFYACGAAVMTIFAFGPSPRVWGHRFWYLAPYRWLLEVPGFNGVRVPARFGALLVLCLAAAAGLAFDRLRPSGARRYMVFAGLVAAGLALDSAARLSAVRVPEAVAIPELQRMTAVLELPLGDSWNDAAAMFRAMTHARPLINGYSGYVPRYYLALTAGLAGLDPRMLSVLTRWGSLGVLVSETGEADDARRRTLVELGARPVAHDARFTLFELDARPPRVASCGGRPLAVASAGADRGNDPGRMLDANLATAWHSGDLQQGGERVVIDVGARRRLELITLDLGPYSADFARGLRVQVSDDQSGWTEAWSGDAASYAVEGALDDPKTVPTRIGLAPPVEGRFIALTQTGQSKNAMWSIAEVHVCGR